MPLLSNLNKSDSYCSSIIYIYENDDLIQELLNINCPGSKLKLIAKLISAKQRNNKIGYFNFLSKNTIYTICIIPKVDYIPSNDFYDFLDFFVSIALSNQNLIKKFSSDFNFTNLRNNLKALKGYIQGSFLESEFEEILFNILAEVKRIKIYVRKDIYFSSPHIKHKIDIIGNIKSHDKTKIKQLKSHKSLSSLLITYTHEVVTFFMQNIFNKRTNVELVRNRCKLILSYIEKNYDINHSSVRISKLYSSPVRRIFSDSRAMNLYENLVFLIQGSGVHSEAAENNISSILIESKSIFVDPSLVYEIFSYRKLKELYSDYELSFKKKFEYSVTTPSGVIISKYANPDIVLCGVDGLVVMDCKWKVVQFESDIIFEDISKLQRDYLLSNATSAVLVYPQVRADLIGTYSINIGLELFEFEVMELKVVF